MGERIAYSDLKNMGCEEAFEKWFQNALNVIAISKSLIFWYKYYLTVGKDLTLQRTSN